MQSIGIDLVRQMSQMYHTLLTITFTMRPSISMFTIAFITSLFVFTVFKIYVTVVSTSIALINI